MEHSLWDILNMAGYAMWIIVGLSVLTVAVALERVVMQWRFMDRARSLADTVGRCLKRGAFDEARSACERSRSPLAEVFLVGYERLGRTKTENLMSAVDRERVRVMLGLKARMWIIGTVGAIAVFVGLFGTVIGIQNAFRRMAESGSNEMKVVSSGLTEALYATAAGIMVAVEAVVLYNFFNQRLARIAVELKMLTDEFLEQLDEHGPQGARAALHGQDEGDKDAEGERGDREAA
ncbi:MAG TPA: MotA/TolQ/ExbB proton channel family protein [Kofleriaceae bacterium]|nr:MotA/TolQ/ExbB proton channel family protein [Kofleriaceae bacterium]